MLITISFANTPKIELNITKIVSVEELSQYPEVNPQLNFRFLTANPHKKKNFLTYNCKKIFFMSNLSNYKHLSKTSKTIFTDESN
jgi:hypothetical protein